MTDLMQVITKVMKERVFGARTSQQPSIGRQRIKGTEETEALDEFTHKGIHRDHTFCFEFAKWHMDGPLIGACGAKAIAGQIGTFTDAHAGVANQQKDIAAQIVAAEEFLLQAFVLLYREWTWKFLREAGNVLTADQVSEFSKLLGPCQFVQDGAQSDELVEVRCGHQWRRLRAQARHPTADVGFTGQLVQTFNLRVIRAEIA